MIGEICTLSFYYYMLIMRRLACIYLFIFTVFLGGCSHHSNTQRDETLIPAFAFEEVTIEQLSNGYAAGEFSIAEVVKAHLERIEALDKNGPGLNAMIALNENALTEAEQLDRELKEGKPRSSMHGIPVILKDNIDLLGMPTTAGARPMANSYPLSDSWVAAKLKEAGAVILGKANLSEWANFHSSFSSSGWSGLGGQTNNPYDLSRNPCGSSAGSGVAVSANYCLVAIGTETNGSIVCPSTSNGVVGIKPTVGLISRSGIIPISFTQDTPGPMARTVRDAVVSLGVLTGEDPADSKTTGSKALPGDYYLQFLNENGLEGKRIGLYTQPLKKHFAVDSLLSAARAFIEAQGATVIEIHEIFPGSVYGQSYEVLQYEFKDGLNKYFASLGPEAPVKSLEHLIELTLADPVETEWFDHAELIMAQEKGDLTDSAYQTALKEMLANTRAGGIDRVMDEHDLDAIMAPTGSPAWKTDMVNGDNFMLSSSSPAAMAGYPNVTVPMGFVQGLPVNISFFGRAWSEPVLIEIAYAYEQGTGHRKAPGFVTGR